MNKPQYLAELNRLLIFMTRADREQTLDRYGALFDKAGPAGQEALLSRIGSPTRVAIRLSRTYEPGSINDELLSSLEDDSLLEPEPEEEAPDGEPSPDEPLVEDELPEYDLPELPDLPDLPEQETPAPEPEPAPKPAEPQFVSVPVHDGEEPAPDDQAPDAPPEEDAQPSGDEGHAQEQDEGEYEELWGKRPPEAEQPPQSDQEPEQAQEPAPAPFHIERTIPLWLGLPLFILTIVFLVLPLTLVGLLLIPTLVLPGLAVLLGAWLAFVGGLWCISIIADAAVLFGLAFILLALGLIVLWIGLWADVAMVSGYMRAMEGLTDLTLGKKVFDHA